MSSITLNGDISGSAIITTPNVAGTPTLTLPTTSGTIVADSATQTLTNKTLTSPIIAGTPTGVGVLTSDTAKASTSGTTVDFTGIPSWVKRITVMLNGVSTNGTSALQVQLGTSSGITATGYIGTSDTQGAAAGTPTAFTTGLGLGRVTAANYARYGQIVFALIGSNAWSGNYVGSSAVVLTIEQGSCAVTLANTLDRIRITTVNGTDAFDAGSINILYE
jgi:hypothetical protein